MKKTIITTIFSAVAALFIAMPAMAATSVSLSPSTINTVEGNNFNMLVMVNPQGVGNYTTKLVFNFPADLMEVTSFNFGDGWMPLTQSGYNLVDNTNGTLIKTGGYPAGYTSGVTFGTISFHAKKSGNGAIKVLSTSVSYDANNNNALGSTLPQTTVAISAIPVAPVKTTPTTPTTPVKTTPVVEQPVTPTTPTVEQPVTQPTSNQASLVSRLVDILNIQVGMVLVIIGLILGFILGYIARMFYKKNGE